MFQASTENQSQLSNYTQDDKSVRHNRQNYKSNESRNFNRNHNNKYGVPPSSHFHKKKASIDSFEDLDMLEANIPIADEDEQNLIGL